METSLMSESVVDDVDVEESVTQVLTHFVQGGGEQVAMSLQLLQEQVEIHLGYDQGSLRGRRRADFLAPQGRFFVGRSPDFFLGGRRRPDFLFLTSLDFLSRLLPTVSL